MSVYGESAQGWAEMLTAIKERGAPPDESSVLVLMGRTVEDYSIITAIS